MSNYIHGPLVFKRGPKKFLAFYAQTLMDFNGFNEKVPLPENKNIMFTDKGKVTDWEHPQWKHEEEMRDRKRWGYMVLKSLEPSQVAEEIEVEEEQPLVDDNEELVLDDDGQPVMTKVKVKKPVVEQLTIPGCSLEDPNTYIKVQQCLTDWLGFYEYQQVVGLVNGAQSLSPDMLEDNLQSFFQLRDAQKAGASQNSEPSNTSDSELASDSA